MSRYPVLYAGQRLTAPLLSSMIADTIVKNSNEDRAATTTLAADTDLTVTLEANAVYKVSIFIRYAALSVAGFQTDWTVPSGASGNRWALGAGSTQVSSDNVGGRWGVHTFATACEYGDRNHATNLMGALEEAIVTTTNAGTLALRWAQATSNATATRVGAGSCLIVQRLS
ncbi:hypothetical protein [Streptomyces sp. NBC_01373]|uniref:hypothetical protein n=1 Tax=Streptomyces sp. NBC_01373 TaxID=2903843 RepID=UPI00225ACFBD|nr:hypothetical protein [Streptomyces sp. NBC_01373]MCX4703857.1 hypothetical protein [Streptomyces sp. NBC_01373]